MFMSADSLLRLSSSLSCFPTSCKFLLNILNKYNHLIYASFVHLRGTSSACCTRAILFVIIFCIRNHSYLTENEEGNNYTCVSADNIFKTLQFVLCNYCICFTLTLY